VNWSSTALRDAVKREAKKPLSPQQRRILAAIAALPGATNADLARVAGTTEGAVKTQICLMRPILAARGFNIRNGWVLEVNL